jgi:hypothetical protein
MKKNSEDDEGTDAIPFTDKMRQQLTMLAEAVIDAIMATKVDDVIADKVAASFNEIMKEIIRFKPDIAIEQPLMEIGNSMISTIMVKSISIAVDELCKNETLFTSRQVIVNAIRGELMNDNRSFIISGKQVSTLPANISAYTDDPAIISAYQQLVETLSDEQFLIEKFTGGL